jgi:two-component system cell cycle sensor histidine kinase/response regulator CckA
MNEPPDQPSAAPAEGARARVLIAEDDRLVALDLSSMVGTFGYEVCGTAHAAEESLELAQRTRPDLVLMDIRLDGEPDGIEAAARMRAALGLHVIYLTGDSDSVTVARASQTEPYGYVLKPVRPLDLRCSLELAFSRVRSARSLSPSSAPPAAGKAGLRSPLLSGLSAREIEVLTLIVRGHTSKDIAQTLGIAKPTVDTYRARLVDKLGAKSRADLVSVATRAGLLGG